MLDVNLFNICSNWARIISKLSTLIVVKSYASGLALAKGEQHFSSELLLSGIAITWTLHKMQLYSLSNAEWTFSFSAANPPRPIKSVQSMLCDHLSLHLQNFPLKVFLKRFFSFFLSWIHSVACHGFDSYKIHVKIVKIVTFNLMLNEIPNNVYLEKRNSNTWYFSKVIILKPSKSLHWIAIETFEHKAMKKRKTF